jgi:hypothetical protein
LRVGYIELTIFIPDEEANICEKAALLLMESENQGKSREGVAQEISTPWFEKVIQINRKIAENSSLRLRSLQEKYGKEDVLWSE